MSLLNSRFPSLSSQPPLTSSPPSPLSRISIPNPRRRSSKHRFPLAASSSPDPPPNPNSKTPKRRRRSPPKPESPPSPDASADEFPSTIPRKPRRGRRSEATAVEDFVRESLNRTFASIRQQDAAVLEGKEEVLKRPSEEEEEEEEKGTVVEEEEEEEEKGTVVEEEDADWPADAEVGWGVRASEYFDKHRIENVVVDGVEIDWEGEMEEGWVKEINCLEWESFAFHPSPLIVLIFERYNRTADNWKFLKELEKAAKVYWSAKDRLPPRTVKIDINIERDLAYALKVKECPQLLFLKGNKILYREKEIRTSEELVKMIAHFYYNAKRPSWIDDEAVAPPF